MNIDYRQLSEAALEGVIEAFVCQEGTDYGEVEYTLAEKVQQVRRQLEKKEVIVLYDADNDSINIVRTIDVQDPKSTTHNQ